MKEILKVIIGFLIGIVLGLFLSRNKQTSAVYKRIEEKRKKDALYAVKMRKNVDEEIEKISKEIRNETVDNVADRFFNVFGRKPKGS